MKIHTNYQSCSTHILHIKYSPYIDLYERIHLYECIHAHERNIYIMYVYL